MGSCCAKNASMGVNPSIGSKPTNTGLIIKENTGGAESSAGEQISTTYRSGGMQIPIIQDPQLLSTQEVGSVDTYNAQDNSAARATLIFPSYSGYRNQDKFSIHKKSTGSDSTPTALVAPYQSTHPSPYMGRTATDFVAQRASPLLSRYSPLLSPNIHKRSRPTSAFDRVNSRRNSMESGGFDSDLESDKEEPPLPNSIRDTEDTRESTPLISKMIEAKRDSETELGEVMSGDKSSSSDNSTLKEKLVDTNANVGNFVPPSKQSKHAEANIQTRETESLQSPTALDQSVTSKRTTSTSAGTDVEPVMRNKDKPAKVSAGTETMEVNSVQMVDASVGTESDHFYRSKNSTSVQVDNKKKTNMVTSSMATETEPPINKEIKTLSVGTDTEQTYPLKQDSSTKTSAISFVKMVDASVGTDSDNFYRAKKSTKVQVDTKKKKKVATSSMAIGTDSQTSAEKSSKGTSVGTDTTTMHNKALSAAQIQRMDVNVDTDRDDFYREKKSTKIQVDLEKKNKSKTSSIATETNTVPIRSASPKAIKRPTQKINTEEPKNQIKHKNPSPNFSLTPTGIPPPKPEPDPIIETLENAFIRFARYGDINSEGREMNNKNWAKLCRDCEFIDNRNVLVGDVDVIFSRHKPKGYRLVDFDMFMNCLNEIADRKYSSKIKNEWSRREIIYQKVIGKAPELVGITGTSKTGNVIRMTDHTLYPVSHKMRFDEEGKGLGIDDKFEIQDGQLGYVQGYKDRDTYELKMLGLTREKSGLTSSATKHPSPRGHHRPASSASGRS